MTLDERRKMLDRDFGLSLRDQCDLLGLNRSTAYYHPVETPEEDLALMKQIDRLYLQFPFYGSRRMAIELRRKKVLVNRKRVQRLMRLMGLEALHPKPKPAGERHEHAQYPYLLKNLLVDRPDQVWASDITYVPLEHGFGYLCAIIDWFSRAVLSWRISNTLDSGFCVEALDEALAKHGHPEICNTDQGSQFTSEEWVSRVKQAGARVSMTGVGRCWDNLFVERLWWSLKNEEVYRKEYLDLDEAREQIGKYFRFYNRRRPHQALSYQTPWEVYRPRAG